MGIRDFSELYCSWYKVVEEDPHISVKFQCVIRCNSVNMNERFMSILYVHVQLYFKVHVNI